MRFGTFATAIAALLLAGPPAAAQDQALFWEKSSKTISDYLNEGWTIKSHAHHVYGDGEEYSFTLSSGSKSVLCFVWVPPRKARTSYCRVLN